MVSWCNAAVAGSFVGTKWEVTSIPIESNNRPYTIEFLKGGKCKFKQDKPDSDIVCTNPEEQRSPSNDFLSNVAVASDTTYVS